MDTKQQQEITMGLMDENKRLKEALVAIQSIAVNLTHSSEVAVSNYGAAIEATITHVLPAREIKQINWQGGHHDLIDYADYVLKMESKLNAIVRLSDVGDLFDGADHLNEYTHEENEKHLTAALDKIHRIVTGKEQPE